MARVFIPGFRKIETSGGGEGGITNYNDLTNKPSINNVPLVGNLNTVDLKLTDATLKEEGVPAEAKTVGQKLEEHSTSLTALSRQLGNHTVKSDVPENAVFTDTVYDDTGIKEEFTKVDNKLTTNLFKPTLGTTTINGVTCTNNGDGTYTIDTGGSGATDYTVFGLNVMENLGGKRVVGCPAGGQWNTFNLRAIRTDTWGDEQYDIGMGVTIPDNFPSDILWSIRIEISQGVVINNLTFKPMVTTNLDADYSMFVPYTGSTGQINSDVASIKNDLGGLSFSVSDGTLSITDGTNTWTLPQTT